jgi:para-nitrobenzyl esterase
MQEPMSEDCLYLNVWTAAHSAREKRPVIVYIHGGGFLTGSGSVAIYDGEETAKKGAVMVTLNYRLGVFGFLSHPELTSESDTKASGNYGLMDQIAALVWIRRNIAAFGGDPGNVTLAGQSAGAMSINVLLASPLTKGLFHQVIAESGALFSDLAYPPILSLTDAEQQGLEFAQSRKVDNLEQLRKMPAAKLTLPFGAKPCLFAPIVDGYLLPNPVVALYQAGKQHPVPILIGSNANEGEALLFGSQRVAKFVGKIMSKYGEKDDWFLSVIPVESDQAVQQSERSIVREQQLGWSMHTWARLAAETGQSAIYYYYFDRVPPGSAFGSFHTAEVEYAYSNLKRSTIKWEPVDVALSGLMSSYWLNFARQGDPNGTGLPRWLPCPKSADEVMELGEQTGMISVPRLDAYRFFDTLDRSD